MFFKIVKVPVYLPVIVPNKEKLLKPPATARESPQNNEHSFGTTMYETLDEFNDIWSDLKRK